MDKDFLKSPGIPSSPAPAYTPVANNDTSYHLAPLINGRLGDIELETVDGKKYLVHKSILEAETVFFHIYYGFVPVWRLQGAAPAPYHTSAPSLLANTTAAHPAMAHNNLNLNLNFGGLSCLRKIITSTLSTSQTTSPSPGTTTAPSQSNSPPPAFASITQGGAVPPPPTSPKYSQTPITAPTPTASPFTWLVPEPSSILTAFLSLIYPRGTFLPCPTSGLTSIEVTGRVIRAALGYQSTKALTMARDHLSRQEWLESCPVEVYALACFYKFGDLAKLASRYAVRRPREEWHAHRQVMGSRGTARLHDLYSARMEGLYAILDRGLEEDGQSSCESGDRERLREMWAKTVEVVKADLGAESELLELLQVDLRGGYCGDCMVVLGKTIQRSLVEARALPMSI